jgi:thiol-disulfide isomerase/thioredoxin
MLKTLRPLRRCGSNYLKNGLVRIIILFLSLFSLASCQAQTPQAKEQTPEPSGLVSYETFDEMAHLLSQDNDTTYLINFWATWCKPCVEEMPFIERLHEDFGDRKFAVVLVSLDFPKQIESKLIPFIEQNKLRSRVVVLLDGDYNAWIDRVDPSWGGAIPATVIYRGDKRVFIDKQIRAYDDLKSVVAGFFE